MIPRYQRADPIDGPPVRYPCAECGRETVVFVLFHGGRWGWVCEACGVHRPLPYAVEVSTR